jgi:hypothetical protein
LRETQTERVLKQFHLLAHGTCRDAEAPGGFGYTAAAANCFKDLQRAQGGERAHDDSFVPGETGAQLF